MTAVDRRNPRRVVHGFVGFEARLLDGGQWNGIQARKTLPLTWRVFDANGDDVAGLGAATHTQIACPLASYGGIDTHLQYLGDGRCQHHWRIAPGLPRSCPRIGLDLDLGEPHDIHARLQ